MKGKAGPRPTADPTHVKDLVPDPANHRRHTPRNIGMIVDALQDVGAARSIVIDEHDTVLAGNGTVEAAAEAGITKVRVIEAQGNEIIAVRRRGLTADQKTRLALYDNRAAEIAEWDIASLAALKASNPALTNQLWTAKELTKLLAALPPKDGETDPDNIPAPRETAVVRGDIYQCGSHRIMCGDSTVFADLAVLMDGQRAECVVTSPPYGVGVRYGDYQDTFENLKILLPLLADRWNTVVGEGGFAVVNFGDIVKRIDHEDVCEYPMALEYFPVFRREGWALWSRRIWCKPSARTNSPQCIQSNRAGSNFEHVWTWKRPGQPVVPLQVSGSYASQHGWFDSSAGEPPVRAGIHGASMPVAVALWLMTIHSTVGGIVHEPFCGAGTTVIAAEQLGRRCFAMELSPLFVQVALDRWQIFSGQVAEKIQAGNR